MGDFVTVGEILRARGVRGEVKVKPLTDDITRFSKLRTVLIDTVPFRVLGVIITPPFVYLRLNGIDTKDKADALKNKLLTIERIHAVEPEAGAFLIADLIGCAFESGELRGRVNDILQHGAADVFEVTLENGKTLLFPFLDSLKLNIDLDSKKIIADKKLLDGVAVYDE